MSIILLLYCLRLQKGIHILFVCIEHQVPEITASCEITYIATMMMIMIGRPRNKRQDSHRTPRKLIARMSLSAYQYLPSNPIEISKAMYILP